VPRHHCEARNVRFAVSEADEASLYTKAVKINNALTSVTNRQLVLRLSIGKLLWCILALFVIFVPPTVQAQATQPREDEYTDAIGDQEVRK
jgi:hypothetical protein